MATKSAYLEIQEHLSKLRPDWERNVTIMEPVPNEPPLLYHISKDTDIQEFIPMVSARTAKQEDKSIPRVCTSRHLWGCIRGYAAVVFEFNAFDDKTFKGGYQIYGLPFELCVRPSKRLLPDVDSSEERWIVGYDEKHLQIKPVKLGQFFVRTIATTRMGKFRQLDATVYLQVNEGFGDFRIHEQLLLKPGYWKIEVTKMKSDWDWPLNRDQVDALQISQTEYLAAKKSVAATLSFESVPLSASW